MVIGSDAEDLPRTMERLAGAAMEAQVLRSFTELDLADHLAGDGGPDGGHDLATLGDRAGCRPDLLLRLLRAALALGLCAQHASGAFTLTPLGATLRRDVPGSMRARVLLLSAPWIAASWRGLTDTVQCGRSTFPDTHGTDLWGYLDAHSDDAAVYNAAMRDNAAARARALLAAVPLPPRATVVDLGGGLGRLIAALLEMLPEARGVLTDRAATLAAAAGYLAGTGVADRVTLAPSDIRESVPTGGDVYLLSRVLHNWPDRDAMAILARCRAVMRPPARLFVLERMVPELGGAADSAALETALTDLNMLVLYGGQERTPGEYGALAVAAGFRGLRIVLETEDFGAMEILQ